MKVTIKRTGGFAGLDQTVASLDSERLPRDAAEELRRQVSALVAASARPEPIGADLLHYHVTISDEGPARTVTVVDEGDPEAPPMKHLQALLALAG